MERSSGNAGMVGWYSPHPQAVRPRSLLKKLALSPSASLKGPWAYSASRPRDPVAPSCFLLETHLSWSQRRTPGRARPAGPPWPAPPEPGPQRPVQKPRRGGSGQRMLTPRTSSPESPHTPCHGGTGAQGLQGAGVEKVKGVESPSPTPQPLRPGHNLVPRWLPPRPVLENHFTCTTNTS